MGLRRGFKAEAERIAIDVRDELGVAHADPLDPHALAKALDIPVVPLGSIRKQARDAVRHFHVVDSGSFSALTVFSGSRRMIVHNDAHSVGRQASNIAHELAHALLFHEPSPALDARGCREVNDVIEEEAGWLGGVLLVPKPAAFDIVRAQLDDDAAAERYGVAPAMIRWRVNATGARTWGRRLRHARVVS